MDFTVRTFLRIYAMNLRRSWRNKPASAKTDASYTTQALFLPPLMLLLLLLYVGVTGMLPDSVGRVPAKAMQGLWFVLATVYWFWMDSHLDRLGDPTQSARGFDDAANRRKVILIYILSFLCIPLIAILGSYAIHSG
jgi:hypothetical protein